jgi:hypothetical protein
MQCLLGKAWYGYSMIQLSDGKLIDARQVQSARLIRHGATVASVGAVPSPSAVTSRLEIIMKDGEQIKEIINALQVAENLRHQGIKISSD